MHFSIALVLKNIVHRAEINQALAVPVFCFSRVWMELFLIKTKIEMLEILAQKLRFAKLSYESFVW